MRLLQSPAIVDINITKETEESLPSPINKDGSNKHHYNSQRTQPNNSPKLLDGSKIVKMPGATERRNKKAKSKIDVR